MVKRIVMAMCLMLGAVSASAQPKAGAAEGSQLSFFLGKWTVDGQSRSTPTGAFGRLTGNETCAWFSGGPSVVCRETTQDPSGEVDSIYILSWDPAKKQYSVHGTDNAGNITSGTGTVAAGVWKWTVDGRGADGSVTPMPFMNLSYIAGCVSPELPMPSSSWRNPASSERSRLGGSL